VSFDVRLERKLGAEKLAALVAQVLAHVADHVDVRAGLVQVERADLDELPGAHGAVEHLGRLLVRVGRRGGLTVRRFPVVGQSPRSLELHGAMFAHVRLHVGRVFQSPVQAKVRVVQAHLGAVFAREKLRYFESVGLNGRGARGLHVNAVRQLVRGQSGVSAERGRTHHANERLVPVDGSSARVRRVPVSVQVHRVQVRGVAVLALDHRRQSHRVTSVFFRRSRRQRVVVEVFLARMIGDRGRVGRHVTAPGAPVTRLLGRLGGPVRLDVRPEPGRAAQILAAYLTLKRFDFHVRDLVFAERGFIQERFVARLARKVPGPVVISAVDVQAHGRLERSAAHLAHCLVVQLVPETDVIVQLILVFELGQAQVAVQVHGGPLRVLVELQVERVPHLGRERLAALRALR